LPYFLSFCSLLLRAQNISQSCCCISDWLCPEVASYNGWLFLSAAQIAQDVPLHVNLGPGSLTTYRIALYIVVQILIWIELRTVWGQKEQL
jgi:hypothetical protein